MTNDLRRRSALCILLQMRLVAHDARCRCASAPARPLASSDLRFATPACALISVWRRHAAASAAAAPEHFTSAFFRFCCPLAAPDALRLISPPCADAAAAGGRLDFAVSRPSALAASIGGLFIIDNDVRPCRSCRRIDRESGHSAAFAFAGADKMVSRLWRAWPTC